MRKEILRKRFFHFINEILKKEYITCFFLTSYHFFSAQATNSNLGPPNIIPPSQETFANSRINFEASGSGQFSYQYAVYDKIKVPIYLNYTSGVKVDDMGSSTGVSWQLNAGGTVSRIVKDETDENNVNWKPETINESLDLFHIRDAARSGNTIDTEYDWFNFSLSNGLAGSFYIDKDLNAYVESKDKVKIEVSNINVPSPIYGKLLEFKIIDKYGTQYFFGGSETNIEKTTYHHIGPDQRAVTGWYLYKILTPDNKQTTLTYSTESLYYYTSLNAEFSYQQKCLDPVTNPQGNSYTYSDVIKSKATIQSYRPKLKNIYEEGTEIIFLYDKERKDIINSNAENNLLTGIEIKNNKTIENYVFEYFDILSTPAATYYNISLTERSTTNRNFLKSITKINQNTKTEFDYYDLDKLPARFSLSSDYYGFPNGKLNTSPFPKSSSDNNFGILDEFKSPLLTADKKVNHQLTSVGNLKKIIHPTKGISEIIYEPNKSIIPVNEDHYNTNDSTLNISCSTFPYIKTVSRSLSFVSNGTPINFTVQISNEIGACSPSTEDDTTWSIEVKENGIHIRTISFKSEEAYSYYTSLSKCAGVLDSHSYCPVKTVNGKTYDITFTINAKHPTYNMDGQFTTIYNKNTVTTDQPLYLGGSRVSSINESNIEGDSYTRNFYYNKLSDISNGKTSIREYNTSSIMAEIRETSRSCASSESGTFPEMQILNVYKGYQNSILPRFNNRRSNLLYTIVTEVIDNKSAIEKRYSYNQNQDSYTGHLPEIYEIPDTNSGELQSDLLLEENTYKFENGKFENYTNRTYKYDFSKIASLKSYVFRENFSYSPAPSQDPLINISYGYYENQFGFYNPTSILTTEYLPNNNTLQTKIDNQYSDLHYQLTSQKTTFPDSSYQTTDYNYAHEKAKTLMIDRNMVGIPLEIVTKKGIKSISKTYTDYPDTLPDTQTGNLLLPKSFASLDLVTGNLSTEVTYNQYDSKGKLQQFTTKGGVPTAIIWGYNQTQPIAKIEGATYAQVSSLATAIIDASNDDANDVAMGNPKEINLLIALDAFRNNSSLGDFQITTYTYDPIIGVRSITYPSGIRELYIYDTANRLQEIRDIYGNLLKSYEYHYKP